MYPDDWTDTDRNYFHNILKFRAPTQYLWLRDVKEMTENSAVIFDVDGTLCDVSSIRHHVMPAHPKFSGKKRFDRFHGESIDCPPNHDVANLAKKAAKLDFPIFIVTSRMTQWRYHTILWLAEHEIPYHDLLMRADNDTRPDYVVKRDLLQQIRHTHTPVLAVDDNPSVLELWREEGILTLEVPGWQDE